MIDTLHQRLILHNLFFASKAQALQEHHGVVLHVVIDFRIEITEQVAGLKVPYPPHVVRNLVQTLQLLGKTRLDGEFLPLGGVGVISFNFHNLFIVVLFFIILSLFSLAQGDVVSFIIEFDEFTPKGFLRQGLCLLATVFDLFRRHG